ncbi:MULTISPECIES: hypothetical protein [unclassified Coleofasciculus]|uniref:hypothetical protein n=1 Tax=unclassified Coleofasciculus TaxID=2692782 RepID=UPI00187E9C7A|nr:MULTISPECIES: hypothetical protein [unclassified Coleofasciculus]MBE9126070.1 hypothetical protein [Coleofasciculus sp. LEGE 07081]MBE9149483.1 hypothetical protein [Coleofasciculus sp. LEGE 07092]
MAQNLDRSKTYESFLTYFAQYAQDFLRTQNQEIKESLMRRQIPLSKIPPLEQACKISLKLGEKLALNPIKKKLINQIEAAAYFLRDFQIGILGQRTSVFHLYEIEIQVDNNLHYALTFESGKLFIQIPYWQMLFLDRYIPYQKLKALWNRGAHLPKLSPARRVWWLLNPIGELRSNLRSMLLLAVQKQLLGLDKLLVKFGLVDGEERENLPDGDGHPEGHRFKDSAIAFLKATVNEEKLGVNLELVLKERDEATLAQLLGVFKKNLSDPGQMEELIDTGALTLQETIEQEQSQVDIKMFGFVNVGNYHRIDVDLNISAGYMKKYVEVIPRNADIKAVQFGFVNVYTIDDITVNPNFHGAMKLNFETAALEQALKELELVG